MDAAYEPQAQHAGAVQVVPASAFVDVMVIAALQVAWGVLPEHVTEQPAPQVGSEGSLQLLIATQAQVAGVVQVFPTPWPPADTAEVHTE